MLGAIEAKEKEQRANFCGAAGARLPSAPAKLIAFRDGNLNSRRMEYLSSLCEEYRLDVLLTDASSRQANHSYFFDLPSMLEFPDSLTSWLTDN